MSIQIYILDASGNLRSQRDLLLKSARLAVKKVQQRIVLDNVDIVIKESENPEIFKDIDGVGGSCPSGFFVQLSIDINHPSFKLCLKKIVENTLIHELHHAARQQAGVSMGKSSFLEYMFSEGLADYFLYELTGDSGKWRPELDKKEMANLKRRAKRKYADSFTAKDHSLWFIRGSKSQRIPQFAGYAIGFEIVKTYMRKHPDESVISLVGTPVEMISGLIKN